MSQLNAREIIDRFGGLTNMSITTGIPIPTLQYWQKTNKLTGWRLDFIELKARENGINLKPANDNHEPIPPEAA